MGVGMAPPSHLQAGRRQDACVEEEAHVVFQEAGVLILAKTAQWPSPPTTEGGPVGPHLFPSLSQAGVSPAVERLPGLHV